MYKKTYTTLRVLKEDAALFKIVAALCHESMLVTFKRLVQQEYVRLQEKEGQRDAALEKDQA